MNRRPGFAMITVLWVITVAGVIASAGALVGRIAANATRNRTELERAHWIANGCAERVRATVDSALESAASYDDAARTWRTLSNVPLTTVTPGDSCDVVIEAAGTRLDVNAASDAMITSLLSAMSYDDDLGGMVAALADWRDTDDVARPLGAERAWYRSAQRELPRNGPLADIAELARVRGFEDLSRFDSVLTTEPGRVSLATAPVTVLMSVPGIAREAAERFVALQNGGEPATDPLSVLSSVSAAAADSMIRHYADIVRLTTVDPDAWILTASATSGFPANRAALELRLVRAGKRCVVTRRRSVI